MTEGEANSRTYPDVEDVSRRERMLAPSEREVEQPYLPGIGDDEVEPTRAPKRRRWRWIVLLLALALVGLGAWRLVTPTGGHEKRTAQEVQPVGAARIGAGDINETLSGLGTVTPLATADRSRIQGRRNRGEIVHKGDFLAQIDDRPYKAAVDLADGQLAHDTGLLEQAQSVSSAMKRWAARTAWRSSRSPTRASWSSRTRGLFKRMTLDMKL